MPGDRVFLDSNVVIYAYSLDEPEKRAIALELCGKGAVVSLQVINEISNVLTGKFRLDPLRVSAMLDELCAVLEVKNLDLPIITKALSLKAACGYSYYDSLIVAAAIASDCAVLYSEDLQHGQMIEGKLNIVNPFLT